MNGDAKHWMGGLTLAALLATPVAQATVMPPADTPSATVLSSNSPYVQGSAANVTTLLAPSAGELFLTLTDLDFPNPFASLQFSVTDAGGTLVNLTNAGTVTLDLTQPLTLYADVFATTQAGTRAGLYNLTATFLGSSPVPLPASGLLLGSGLALAMAMARRRRVTWSGHGSLRAA